MAPRTRRRQSKTATRDCGAAIGFSALLHRPVAKGKAVAWTFLVLPAEVSRKLPSRGMVSVGGTLGGAPFQAMLQPDGKGGHWLKVDRKLREAAGAKVGDTVSLEFVPTAEEPEPKVPPDLRRALAGAPAGKAGSRGARDVWSDITPAARRDWVHWIESAKQSETRERRVAAAIDMLTKGKRRPCCFDRSGMYSKSLGCPESSEHPGSAKG
ncbi:MAG: YdeI/OmpD-associated family protein [Phycisphaerales bacterium]